MFFEVVSYVIWEKIKKKKKKKQNKKKSSPTDQSLFLTFTYITVGRILVIDKKRSLSKFCLKNNDIDIFVPVVYYKNLSMSKTNERSEHEQGEVFAHFSS